MEGLSLLRQAREAGLRVHADGDELVVRGPRRLEALALELLLRHDEILAVITPERGPWPTQTWPLTVETFQIQTLQDLSAPGLIGEPSLRCYACGGYPDRWRPRSDRTRWRCALCYPPPADVELEYWDDGRGAP